MLRVLWCMFLPRNCKHLVSLRKHMFNQRHCCNEEKTRNHGVFQATLRVQLLAFTDGKYCFCVQPSVSKITNNIFGFNIVKRCNWGTLILPWWNVCRLYSVCGEWHSRITTLVSPRISVRCAPSELRAPCIFQKVHLFNQRHCWNE